MAIIDVDTAMRTLREHELREEQKREEERKVRREGDRRLRAPAHFHATVWCFASKDSNGNFVDSMHHEVLGLSPDACIRKALNRSEARQSKHHLAVLTECAESHPIGRLED